MDIFTVQPDQNVKFVDSQSSWLRAYKFAVYSLNRVCTIISTFTNKNYMTPVSKSAKASPLILLICVMRDLCQQGTSGDEFKDGLQQYSGVKCSVSSILFGKGFTFFQIKNGFKNEKLTQHNNYENNNCTDSYPVAILCVLGVREDWGLG